MNDAVIFDFGNVLGTVDKMRACARLADHSSLPAEEIHTLIVGSELERSLESGEISGDFFCKDVIHQIGGKLRVSDVMRIWGDIFSPNPIAEQIVSLLAMRNIRMAVLSNTNEVHWPYISALPVMKFLHSYGAPMVLSYRIRSFKPDRRMFETALARIETAPSRALYIDDLAAYVAAARSLGMPAEIYDCSKDVTHIREIMEDYSLLQ